MAILYHIFEKCDLGNRRIFCWVLRIVFDYSLILRAGLPSSVRLCFGQTCSPCESGRFRRPSPRSAYTYTPSGASPAVIVSLSKVPLGFDPKQSRAWHPRELGNRRMRSSLASGKSSTPPARCIHRPLRDTSSAEYRLLVSLASVGASRELSSRRSPAHPSSDRLRGSLRSGDTIPHTCAVSPTFRYGAFSFVVFALAAFLSARLTAYNNHATNPSRRQQSACLQVPNYRFKKSRTTQYREFATSTPMLTSIKHIDRFHPSADITVR